MVTNNQFLTDTILLVFARACLRTLHANKQMEHFLKDIFILFFSQWSRIYDSQQSHIYHYRISIHWPRKHHAKKESNISRNEELRSIDKGSYNFRKCNGNFISCLNSNATGTYAKSLQNIIQSIKDNFRDYKR